MVFEKVREIVIQARYKTTESILAPEYNVTRRVQLRQVPLKAVC